MQYQEPLPDLAPPNEEKNAKSVAASNDTLGRRLVSLDAYRGFIMIVLAGAGFGIANVARTSLEAIQAGDSAGVLSRDPRVLESLVYHFSHPDWISQAGTFPCPWWQAPWLIGCSFWDLIQPSFMFMVGVAMVYSYSKRKLRGDSRLKTWTHVLTRSLLLVLLGVFLSSNWADETCWEFFNVLSQIGLGYVFVYLLWDRPFVGQLAAAAVILIGSYLAFQQYPAPGPDFDYASVGIAAKAPAEGPGAQADAEAPAPIDPKWKMPERFAPWTKNVNAAAAFDRWFLNLFPRSKPFRFNAGGYTTLNFIPSIFTMLLGVMAGHLLRGNRNRWAKFGLLVLGGAICLALGAVAGPTVCPVVKRIWTPSWALLAGGWTLWMLAVFYLLFDCLRLKLLAWPLVVVGMNSITMYLMAQLLKPWAARTLRIHFGDDFMPDFVTTAVAQVLCVDTAQLAHDGVFGPIVQSVMVLLLFWLICVWLYRQRIFIRL